MQTRKNLKNSITNGPLFSGMIIFALPLMMTNLISQLYTIADNIVIGQFSNDPNALAAIGCTMAYTSLINAFIIGCAAGASVIVAKSIGAKNFGLLSRGVHTAVSFSLILGAVFCLIGFSLTRPVLLMMGTKAELLESSLLYVRIICLGIPAVAVYQFGAAVLRASGDSRAPFVISLYSGGINVVLNLIFVILFHMSVEGVAIATVIAQYTSSASVILLLIKRRSEPYALRVKELRLDGALVGQIVRLGLPAGIQGSLFGVSNILLNSVLNTFPTPVISAKTIATNIDVMLSTMLNSYLHVTTTFVGQNSGANKPDRIKKSVFYSLLQVTVMGVVLGQIMILFRHQLAGLYIAADNPFGAEIHAATDVIMTIMLSGYFIAGLNEAMSGFIRGMGHSLPPMLANIGGVCVFRFVWIYLIFPTFKTLEGLFFIYPASWALTFVILCAEAIPIYRREYRELPQKLNTGAVLSEKEEAKN